MQSKALKRNGGKEIGREKLSRSDRLKIFAQVKTRARDDRIKFQDITMTFSRHLETFHK